MMKNTTKQFEIIKNDFKFKNKKNDLIKLNFLNNVSASPVWLSKKTGLVFHNEPRSSVEIAKEWSEKIFSNKMDTKKHHYTDNIPEMRARHYYVLDYMNSYLKLKFCIFCLIGFMSSQTVFSYTFFVETSQFNDDVYIIENVVSDKGNQSIDLNIGSDQKDKDNVVSKTNKVRYI